MRPSTKITCVFLTAILLSTVFLGYWGYSVAQKNDPATWMDIVAGQAQAPVQYRIGVILPAYAVTQHSPLKLRHVFAGIDLAAAFVSVFSLLFLLHRSELYRKARTSLQWFSDAAFVALVQFYFLWLLWYQRPETLLTGAILALSLLLLTVRIPLPEPAGYCVTIAGLVVLALAQGFVRADVAFSLHMGVLVVCLFHTKGADDFALPRWIQAGTSLVAAGVCGGLQLYLMHVVYPNAKYKDAAMFQLPINLTSPSQWPPFLLFVAPFVWTIWTLNRRKGRSEGPALGFATGAAIFMGLWLTAGRVEEVRIFLPFALGVAPLTAVLAMDRYRSTLGHEAV